MGNCKDCKNWDAGAFHCEAPSWVNHFPEGQWSPGEAGIALAVMASDDQGLDVGLKTGPMFGCTKFESKQVGVQPCQ